MANQSDVEFFVLADQKESDEELLQKTIEGRKAFETLCKTGKLQFKYDDRIGWEYVSSDPAIIEYRLKKKTFQSFDVGRNWKVEDNVSNIKIGCQLFDKIELRNGLYSLLHTNTSQFATSKFQLNATRLGINNGEYSISWAEAEQIYNVIKKQ
jgi:hypothetical protein